MEDIPIIDVYLESILTKQSLSEFSRYHEATFYYVVAATAEDVISFFDNKITCTIDKDSQNTRCQGSLENGSGDYFVYFNENDMQDASQTTYAVEVRWRVCYWGIYWG